MESLLRRGKLLVTILPHSPISMKFKVFRDENEKELLP